jgi:hypothetical protein
MSLLDEPDVVPEVEPAVLPEPDFMSVDDEPAPVPDPVAGELAEPLVLPLAEGDDDAPLDGELPLLSVLLAPALDPDPPPDPLAAPAPPLWANAVVASIAPATVSAKALIHVFMCSPPGADT